MKHARASLAVLAVAALARAAVVAWGFARFPPIADGFYFDVLGRRMADGLGYTWMWPDGSVSYVAHYPVGYPGIVAASYRLFGFQAGSAMIANAALGALAAVSLHRALLYVTAPRSAFILAIAAFALHPALLSYTPALMTEGVSADLAAIALHCALGLADAPPRARIAFAAALGLVTGAATLVRPQMLLYAPLLAIVAFAIRPRAERSALAGKLVAVALVATAAALSVVLPWTARNCARMDRCALVSLNGGWNLLIGTDEEARGTWAPVKMPAACVDVTGDAAVDACFAREATRRIAAAPGTWAALAPKKLAATFNHVGAGPWYLHDANPSAFPKLARTIGGTLEEVVQRVLYALVLSLSAVFEVERLSKARRHLALGAAVVVGLAVPGWITVLLTIALSARAAAAALGRGAVGPARAFGLGAAFLAAMALTHVVFFGAGRYALVAVPVFALLLGAGLGALAASRAKVALDPPAGP